MTRTLEQKGLVDWWEELSLALAYFPVAYTGNFPERRSSLLFWSCEAQHQDATVGPGSARASSPGGDTTRAQFT